MAVNGGSFYEPFILTINSNAHLYYRESTMKQLHIKVAHDKGTDLGESRHASGTDSAVSVAGQRAVANCPGCGALRVVLNGAAIA